MFIQVYNPSNTAEYDLKKIVLFSTFTILWLLDTIFALMFINSHSSGLMSEGNPVVRFVYAHSGPVGFIVFKAFPVAILGSIYKHIHNWIYYGIILLLIPVVYAGAHMAFWPI